MLYVCPRCGYSSTDFYKLKRHSLNKRPCSKQVIEFNDEVQQIYAESGMEGLKYYTPPPPPSAEGL